MNKIQWNMSWLDRLNNFRRLRLVERQIKAKELRLETFIERMSRQYPLPSKEDAQIDE